MWFCFTPARPLSYFLFCFIRTCTQQSCCSSQWSISEASPHLYCCRKFLAEKEIIVFHLDIWHIICNIPYIHIWSASLSDSIKSLPSHFWNYQSGVVLTWMIWLWLAKILLILNFTPTQTAFESGSLTLEQDAIASKMKVKVPNIRERCHCF